MSEICLSLVEIARLALRRHAEARARQPKRGATAYLRAALRAARQMASLSKTHPDLLTAAIAIVGDVIRVAHDAEASVFAKGGNSSAYLTLLASAEALRLTLLAKALPQGVAPPKPQPAPPSEQPEAARPRPSSAATPVASTPLHVKTPTPIKPPVTRHPRYHKASGAKLKVS